MNESSWMKDPSLQGIDPAKLNLLASLAEQVREKGQNEKIPFLISALSNYQNLSLETDEMNAILSVLKSGKSQKEAEKIDRIWSLLKQFRK